MIAARIPVTCTTFFPSDQIGKKSVKTRQISSSAVYAFGTASEA